MMLKAHTLMRQRKPSGTTPRVKLPYRGKMVGPWLLRSGKLPEHEAERAGRTASDIAHHLDMDGQEGYGLKR